VKGTYSSRGGKTRAKKPLPQGGKAAAKKPLPQGGKAAAKKPLPQGGKAAAKKPLPEGPVDWRTRQEADWWIRNVVVRVRDGKKRRLMEALIFKNMHLPHEQFKEQVLSVLDRMLEEKKKGRPDKF